MCCGGVSKPNNNVAKQSEPLQQNVTQPPSQQDTGNPIINNLIKSNNVGRANEMKRNAYHSQHFGGR